MKYERFRELEKVFSKSEHEFTSAVLSSVNGEKYIDVLSTYYNLYKDSKTMWEYIKLINSEDTFVINGKGKSIQEIDKELLLALNNGDFNYILLEIENSTYEDMNLLYKYGNVFIKYDNDPLSFCTLSDFIRMREEIDYYKAEVCSEALFPLEQVTYIYDITKSFKYSDTEEDFSISRALHSCICSSKFVCVGYVKFMNQLLTELGFDCYTVEMKKHVASIVRIVDETYGIDGYYVFDPTADSRKKMCLCKDTNGDFSIKYQSSIVDSDEIIYDFGENSLYRSFLIPLEQYRDFYLGEESVSIFDKDGDDVTSMFLDRLNSYDKYIGQDLKCFLNLMYNVKCAEGYSKDDSLSQVCNLITINNVNPDDEHSLNSVLSEIDNEYRIEVKTYSKK